MGCLDCRTGGSSRGGGREKRNHPRNELRVQRSPMFLTFMVNVGQKESNHKGQLKLKDCLGREHAYRTKKLLRVKKRGVTGNEGKSLESSIKGRVPKNNPGTQV